MAPAASPEPKAVVESPLPAPTLEPQEAPSLEPWERAFDVVPSVVESMASPIVEKAPEWQPAEADTVEQVEGFEEAFAQSELASEPRAFEGAEQSQQELRAEPETAAMSESAPEPESELAPAFPEEQESAPIFVDDAVDVAPAPSVEPRRVYETPVFVPLANPPAVESLIDEVDAAFITAGLPSSGALASDDALHAAHLLEATAKRLRAGHIQLRSPGEVTSEEAALAAVLAALLANR
jgi:hypothetical protein